MADPGYDFFAVPAPGTTGAETPETPGAHAEPGRMSNSRFGTAPAAVHAVRGGMFGSPTLAEPVAAPSAPAPAPVNRFGIQETESAPEPVRAHAGAAPTVLAPPPSPALRAAGYDPGSVNQFGTPLAQAAAPTGPYAAPGVAAVPTSGPGMVSTSDAAGAPARARSRQAAAPVKPGAVTAAGVIGIVEGVFVALAAVVGLLGYLALRGELASLDASLSGSGIGSSTLTGVLLVGLVVLMAISALYLVAGIATVKGKRWGAWTLLAVSALNVLYALYQMAQGTTSTFSGLLTLAVSGAVVALLSTGQGRRWLMSA